MLVSVGITEIIVLKKSLYKIYYTADIVSPLYTKDSFAYSHLQAIINRISKNTVSRLKGLDTFPPTLYLLREIDRQITPFS